MSRSQEVPRKWFKKDPEGHLPQDGTFSRIQMTNLLMTPDPELSGRGLEKLLDCH